MAMASPFSRQGNTVYSQYVSTSQSAIALISLKL